MISQSTVQVTVAAIALAADADYKKRMFYPQDVDPSSAGAKHGYAKGFETKAMKFKVQQGTTPSEALYSFFHGGDRVVCECHAFVMAVYYYTVRELLGADLFDAHFADMDISGKFSPTSPLRKVLREKRMGNIDGDIQKGDWIYITNIPEYKERHPFGNAPGWNLICVSDDRQQYVGFGLSDSSDGTHGKSIDEIKTILVDEYKKPPKMEFTSSSSTSRGRSGSFGSQMDTKKSVKYSDAQEAVESASKMIGGLKKQSMSFSSITEPYFEPDSKRYRISSAKLNQIIQGGI